MRKSLFFLLILIFLFTSVYASCDSGQIDINNADATELDKLIGIGPAYANEIINSRPFNSVDDLIDVNGIGPVTLEKIKNQNLACVENEEEKENIQYEEEPQEDDKLIEDKESEIVEKVTEEPLTLTGEEVKTIILSPKDIKSETDKEDLNKGKLATYGLVGFCILLVSLFAFKKINKEKNEFK